MSKFGVTDRFAFLVVFVFYLITITVGFFYHSETIENEMNLKEESKLLNHIVLIKFKENLSSILILYSMEKWPH